MLDDIIIYKGYVIEVSQGSENFYGDIFHDGDLKHSVGDPSKGGCVSECVSYINYLISEEK